jgi:alpha-L-rhamnosidase
VPDIPHAQPGALSLKVEHGIAFGVATATPRLSWQVQHAADGWVQQSYELALNDGSGWRSIEEKSPESVLVPWPFAPLTSRERVRVKARATGEDGSSTQWSEPIAVEAALLVPDDWVARMVAPDWPEDLEGEQPPALLRKEFAVGEGLAYARLYITGHGLYNAHVSGHRVGDELFAPGWSAYRSRLRYQAHDVTELLPAGANAVGITLADGWYRGYLMPTITRRNWYGSRVAVLAQLELTYQDGRREVVASDESWRSGQGPLRSADIYRGETYDARLEPSVAGWQQAGYDDSAWSGCLLVERDLASVVRQDSPPVRRTQTVQPVSVGTSPSGTTIVDFGQNLVGHLRLQGLTADAGAEVVLRHAEILQDGELCTEPLRAATATDTLIANGRPQTWEPEFTFHGFRYAEIRGVEVGEENVTAEVVHSDMRRTGWFSCSDPLINRLHDNAVWSMRGNFLDVPTDCPQRDERLGWTGDLQVFAPTASFLYDSHGLLVSWLADLAADQDASGGVPYVVPNPIGRLYNGGTAAAWSDAAVIVPWVLYQRRGDRDVLARQWPSMIAFTDCLVREHGPDLNPELYQFGDWVDPRAPGDAPGDGPTDKMLVAAAYLVYALDIMTATAELLGASDEEARYRGAAQHYRGLWQARFVQSDGRLSSDTETAYSLAICFGLLASDAERAQAGARLAELLAAGGYRIATGFVGTPLVCDALTATGQLASAYRLLMQTEPPSFLYPVTQGATTVWERWDSLMPDGRVNPSEMTSFNHYALGAVVDWLHRCVGGLAPLAPGYREVLVRPLPGGGLTSAQTRHTSPYGEIAVRWDVDPSDGFQCEVVVPAGASALVVLPVRDWEPQRIGHGRHVFSGTLALREDAGSGTRLGAPWDAAGLAGRESS